MVLGPPTQLLPSRRRASSHRLHVTQAGALPEFLLIPAATLGHSLAVIPGDVPLDVAALNEPMAVARHAV
jgi:threonine dehydrogenase-like Zn-dependent dehydrogenase